MSLSDIEHIVIVLMENRSFDHMLGYRGLAGGPRIEGLRSDPLWRGRFANLYEGKKYESFPIDPAAQPCSDPKHDQHAIARQIGKAPAGPGRLQMGGFVESYAEFSDPKPTDRSQVMGYFDAAAVPTFDFFAKNYCVCDHWFASLPLGTQANRLMAMAGESKVVDNVDVMLFDQPLVYDWLTAKNIPWRAYQSGDSLPFFALMPRWLPEIATSLTLGCGRFRRFSQLAEDWKLAEMPNVIFVEPEYTDGLWGDFPNDDHSPTGVAPGQAFLADLYNTLVSNPARWARTLLLITYDEHGGFFDHVSPLRVPANVNGTAFATTGVRVPAFLISPYVAAEYVFDRPLDHTSILQLLDDRFVTGEGYSEAVNERQMHFDRLLNALLSPPRSVPAPQCPVPNRPAPQSQEAARAYAPPRTANEKAFHAAAQRLAADFPEMLSQPGWERLKRVTAGGPVHSADATGGN